MRPDLPDASAAIEWACQTDPEKPGHFAKLNVWAFVGGCDERVQCHAANRTVSCTLVADLGMHGTGIDWAASKRRPTEYPSFHPRRTFHRPGGESLWVSSAPDRSRLGLALERIERISAPGDGCRPPSPLLAD